MAKGFDCATKLNAASAKALKAEGFDYVARYLGNSWKSFDKDEVQAIQSAGLKLISIFEKNSTKASYFSKSQGIADAKEAEGYAKAVGQPKGSAIYFTVDYDAQPTHMDKIKEYVAGLNQALVDYEVGLYGSYSVMQAVKGLVKYHWQTYAWSRGKVADFIHMHQYENDIRVAGIGIDRNEIKKDPGHWQVKSVVKPSVSKPVVKNKTEKYKIKKGDTFWDLEEKNKWDHGTLQKLNPKVNPSKLQIGQTIYVPIEAMKKGKVKPKYHIVVKGDTVSELAQKYGSTIQQIKDWNKLDKNYTIYAGKKIRVK